MSLTLNRQQATVVLLLTACVMVGVGAIGLTRTWGEPLVKFIQMAGWDEVDAVIDEVWLISETGESIQMPKNVSGHTEKIQAMPIGRRLQLHARYHYVVHDQVYSSERFSAYPAWEDADTVREAAARLYRKKAVQVWVDPVNPSEAVLSRVWQWSVMILGLPFFLVAGLGVWVMAGSFRSFWYAHRLLRARLTKPSSYD